MTWPPVFDGRGALFVRADNDPRVQFERIPGLTWCALKVNGVDASPPAEQASWVERMRALGPQVGAWVYNAGPPEQDFEQLHAPWSPSLFVYNPEVAYKRDEGGHYEYAHELVQLEHRAPVAVTSYGGYKTSIDFAAFANAGWPMFAQAYDAYTVPDAATYTTVRGGPYPAAGVHTLVRSLNLVRGQAVYRPESIDS